MKIHILFGMGNCERIKEILNDKSDFKLFVFKPYRENFDTHGKLLPKDKRIVFMIHSDRDMVDFLGSMFSKEKPADITFEILDKYEAAYPQDLEYFKNHLRDALEIYDTSNRTFEKLQKSFDENLKCNMVAIRSSRNIARIKKKGNVAYIIAGGSSLDKNILELKNAKGMIIATDTAINPLLDNGIIPDLAVTIDPNKSALHFKDKKSLNIPLVAHVSANKEIIARHKGIKYFVKTDSVKVPNDKLFNNMKNTLTCGSVTSDAMHVATLIGYKTIVFVGLDLAYTNDKSYANGTVNHGASVQDGYEMCEDIDGNSVPTTKIFQIYRKWIERYIKARPHIRFIDCTEGGAKIDGTEIMDLKTFNGGIVGE